MATTSETVTTSVWLRRYQPDTRDSSRRLVCFPHAGGSASFFYPMATWFAPEVEVIAVQYPGRQDRRLESCVEDIVTLADLIAAELRGLPPKPTVFFGHSMGSVVAFETAWRLQRSGDGPGGLVASGRRAPSIPCDGGIHRRDDAGLLAEIRRLNGTEAGALEDEDVVRMALPAIRSDYRAVETYRASRGRVLSCPITALMGSADSEVTSADADAWRHHTTGEFGLTYLPGGHFYLIGQQTEVNRRVRAELDRWTAS